MKPYQFSLDDVRLVTAVADEGSIVAAARRLNMTASPLSRRILEIEAKLGLTLFLHRNRRVRITPTGQKFVEAAKPLLDRAEQLRFDVADLESGMEDHLRVGYVPGAMMSGFLPQAIRRFRSQRPKLRLQVVPMRSRQQVDALHTGEIDLGFLHTPPLDDTGLVLRKVHEDAFALVCHEDAQFDTPIDPAQLGEEPWIGLSETVSPDFRKEFRAACNSFGFDPMIRHEGNDIPSILGLVEAGLGLALMQERLARLRPPGVRFISMPGFLPRAKLFACISLGCESAAANSFLELLPEV